MDLLKIRKTSEGVTAVLCPKEGRILIPLGCWIGFDLDGTLAAVEDCSPPFPIGKPLPRMMARVFELLDAGVDVKIFTARANDPGQVVRVNAWLDAQGIGHLPVTATKDFMMIRCFDDRAIQVLSSADKLLSETSLIPDLRKQLCPKK